MAPAANPPTTPAATPQPLQCACAGDGNAAARVVAALGGQSGGALVRETYQDLRKVTIGGRVLAWHALVHPAVRQPWTEIHRAWRESRR